MTAHAISDFRILIVPGMHNSGTDHWQSRWQQLYPSFERVEQAQWDRPDLLIWSERLGQALRDSNRPTLIVAHSFGCLTTIHRANIGAPNLYGTLLVAPADPDKFGIEDQLRKATLPCPSLVVGSRNDPWMTSERAMYWSRLWNSRFIDAGALGHINVESGLGDWQQGLTLLQCLAHRAGTIKTSVRQEKSI
jgi:hypothetical protein